MIFTAGIDVGSTYTKALILGEDGSIRGRALSHTGFKLAEISKQVYETALQNAGLVSTDVSYVVARLFSFLTHARFSTWAAKP